MYITVYMYTNQTYMYTVMYMYTMVYMYTRNFFMINPCPLLG